MGSGIAEVCARAGLDVIVREIDDAAAAAARARIAESLGRGVRKGKLSEAERDEALRRVAVVTSLGELADRDLVIEAATESPALKAACSRSSTRRSRGRTRSWRRTPRRSRSPRWPG